MSLLSNFLLCLLILGIATVRVYALLPNRISAARSTRWRNASDKDKCSLAVFLGSGGHTSEALALVSTLDFSRYSPRKYVISEGDTLSAKKARDLESECVRLKNLTGNSTSYEVVVVPRARRVHQPLITTPPTAMRSLISVFKYMIHFPSVSNAPFADVLLLNGPGTCFVLCAAVYILKFLGLPAPRVIYVESFARVNSLSLSGKLLRPLVDRFVVQWPQLLRDGGRGECRGWLV